MTHILFVDDDPSLLAGLRRSLRRERHRWDTRFVGSGADALAACAERPPDVLVTDLQMPGMDGEELLRQVAERHPDVVRLVLSGLADRTRSLHTVHLAHQFLAKPCEADDLTLRLERVVGLRELLHDERLRADLGGTEALPQAPGMYLELQRAMARDDVSTHDVAQVVERDPTLSATVLKVVNSAFVGLPRTVDTVERAVILLGITMVEDIVLAADAARTVGPGLDHLLDAFQSHAAATAMLAQRIAPPGLAGAARTAGFLHDLGGLFLAARRPEELRQLSPGADDSSALHDRMVATWGVAPSELGAYLLGMWGLPLALVDGVAAAAHPRWRCLGLAETLHIADALVHDLVPHPTPFSSAPRLDVEGVERIGHLDDLDQWVATAEQLVFGAAA